jgi:hypothetical protein
MRAEDIFGTYESGSKAQGASSEEAREGVHLLFSFVFPLATHPLDAGCKTRLIHSFFFM